MWLFTNKGFYSIVEKPWDVKDQTLTARARCREDIDRLLNMLSRRAKRRVVKARQGFQAKGSHVIEEAPVADYRWRIRLPRNDVKTLMLAHIDNITYDNFKSSVSNVLHDHAAAYSSVWSTMHRLQEPRPYGREDGGAQSHLPFAGSGSNTGGAVARELGYSGHKPAKTWTEEEPVRIRDAVEGLIEYDPATRTWNPVEEDKTPALRLCPFCDEVVDPERFDLTGQCDACGGFVEVCSTCYEFKGPAHKCLDEDSDDDLPY